MRKLICLNGQKIDNLELNRGTTLTLQNIFSLIKPFIRNFGFIIPKSDEGLYSDDWQVQENGLRTINIKAGKCVFETETGEPVVLELDSDLDVSIPIETGTYNIVLKHKDINEEKGKVTLLNGSRRVTGSATENFYDLFRINREIIVNGNAHIVVDVISENELDIAEIFTGENIIDASFSIGGWFANAPQNLDLRKCYHHDALEVKVTNQAAQEKEYLIAVVEITDNTISSLIDKRLELLFRSEGFIPDLENFISINKRKTIWTNNEICSDEINNELIPKTENIKADPSHPTELILKMRIPFYKEKGDELLAVNYTTSQTDTGIDLSSDQKEMWGLELGIENQENKFSTDLSSNLPSVAIDNLAEGCYYFYFKLKNIDANYNLSILVNEIYIESKKVFIEE